MDTQSFNISKELPFPSRNVHIYICIYFKILCDMSSDYIHIYTFIYIYIDGVFSRVYMYIYIYIYIFVLVYTCESEYFCILYSILLYLYMFMLCFWHNSISISAKMLHWRSGGTHGYVAPEQLGNCGATLVKFASKGHP